VDGSGRTAAENSGGGALVAKKLTYVGVDVETFR